MSRSKECVVAVYKKLTEVGGAVQAIDRGGLPMKLVSLVSSSLGTEIDGLTESYRCYQNLPQKCPRTCEGSTQCEWTGACVPKILQFGDDMQRNAVVGAGVGGALGLVAGVSVLTLAQQNAPLLLAPVVATSGIVGGFLGAMTGWGTHSHHLPWYEQKVQAGNSLLVVHGNPLEVAKAARILQDTHPAAIRMHAESAEDAHEIRQEE